MAAPSTAPRAEGALMTLEGVGKQYTHADGPVDALAGVDLVLPEGAFVTVTGPSGSGKSTLLSLLGGLTRPTSGRIAFRDRSLDTLPEADLALHRRLRLGFVMQSFCLIPYLTAVENVELALALAAVDRKARREKALALLGQVDLSARANHLPRELSMGQQQRVALARAFAKEPLLVLADEPTGNLDPRLARDILDLLERMNRERQTAVVMVTHSPEAAARGTLRVALEGGRVADASPALRLPAFAAR
ncbi:MAG: ABC transporter ATP-binding protein [Planctomycetia bacterium]|nr:ABC transporter ATP-binding protein [Planctomycetia bacterium]